MQRLTRRVFLGAAAGLAAVGVVGTIVIRNDDAPGDREPTAERDPRPGSGTPARPVAMAMHVHACFSEGFGSMQAQLVQAELGGYDVVWWTEHDHRMSAHRYRTAVHFDGAVESEDGRAWEWVPPPEQPGTGRTVEYLSGQGSPRDPATSQCLRLALVSTAAAEGAAENRLLGQAQGANYRTCLHGQSLEIDVRTEELSSGGYLAFDVLTSYRPRMGDTAEGRYRLSYRTGPDHESGERERTGRTGIVWMPATQEDWTTWKLGPEDDFAEFWPDIDSRDVGVREVSVLAGLVAPGTASGLFDALSFRRAAVEGDEPLRTQAAIMADYADQFPSVTQYQALELSAISPHVGWYGGTVVLPALAGAVDAGTSEDGSPDAAAARRAIATVHEAGGLASYNHMFGTSTDLYPDGEQDQLRETAAISLVGSRALGCDLIEVGFRARGGCDLAHHTSVWDSCSRNAIFLTGIGVNDDHNGFDWAGSPINFATWAWATDTSERALLGALAAGRACCGDPSMFEGVLDLIVDGEVPMGAVSVSPAQTRSLTISSDGVSEDAVIEIIRGEVDYAGSDGSEPVTTRSTLAGADLAQGMTTLDIDTSTSCFLRVVVSTAAGTVIVVSNPIWLLREEPPEGIPSVRSS